MSTSNFWFTITQSEWQNWSVGSWATLLRYGVAFFRGSTSKTRGSERILHCVGLLKQRTHLTNNFVISQDKMNAKKIDHDIYAPVKHPVQDFRHHLLLRYCCKVIKSGYHRIWNTAPLEELRWFLKTGQNMTGTAEILKHYILRLLKNINITKIPFILSCITCIC